MLKDYLAHHEAPRLIVLHVPQARASENGPHPQAYRWLRYGDLQALPAGFPLVSKLQLYGEMVLGAPRQALTLLRPNRLGIEAPVPVDEWATALGTPPAVRPAGTPSATAESVPAAALLPPTAPLFEVLTPSLKGAYRFAMGPYTQLFLAQIAGLAKGAGAKLVLIHLPLGQDPLTDRVQELQPWTTLFGPDVRIIAIPKARLFAGVDPGKFYFSGDNHMNTAGGKRFTESIAPSVAEAYLEASPP
jgi:hypothetical protein